MAATIEVRISKNGKIKIDVIGATDASCSDLTRALEVGLGEVESVQRKPEYYVELDGIKQEIHETDEE
jgi:hypothetical protein